MGCTQTATTGRNTIRRSTQTLPDGNVITYNYRTGIDADSSRVSEVKDGSVILASYSYNGPGSVVAIDLQEPDVMWKMHGTSSGSYPDLDRFNRVTSTRSDFDLSGTVGAADLAEVTANSGTTLGWGVHSDATNVANRKGYAGYEIDIAIGKLYHVRYTPGDNKSSCSDANLKWIIFSDMPHSSRQPQYVTALFNKPRQRLFGSSKLVRLVDGVGKKVDETKVSLGFKIP